MMQFGNTEVVLSHEEGYVVIRLFERGKEGHWQDKHADLRLSAREATDEVDGFIRQLEAAAGEAWEHCHEGSRGE